MPRTISIKLGRDYDDGEMATERVTLHTDASGDVRAFDASGAWLATFNEATGRADGNDGIDLDNLKDAISDELDAELDKPFWKFW